MCAPPAFSRAVLTHDSGVGSQPSAVARNAPPRHGKGQSLCRSGSSFFLQCSRTFPVTQSFGICLLARCEKGKHFNVTKKGGGGGETKQGLLSVSLSNLSKDGP